MPLYEYVSETDGEKIELLRPMSEADTPVTDPAGKGRTFKRVMSTFAPPGAGGGSAGVSASGGGGGCCPCGKSAGACSRN
jgi:predicted nucleic acid-binding Zn ribbon protein